MLFLWGCMCIYRRVEDVTDPDTLRKLPKTDRSVCLYGYVRGCHYRNHGHVHIPGLNLYLNRFTCSLILFNGKYTVVVTCLGGSGDMRQCAPTGMVYRRGQMMLIPNYAACVSKVPESLHESLVVGSWVFIMEGHAVN